MGCVGRDGARDEVADHDASGVSVDHDDIEHLGSRKHLHRPEGDLPRQRLIGTEQQLLSGLASRIERAGNLRAAERAVVQQSPVLSCERDSLGHTLIDDVLADLRESIDVGLPRTEIPALHSVIEETPDTVPIILIVLGCVDPALGRDGVRSPWAVLKTEAFDTVSELGE